MGILFWRGRVSKAEFRREFMAAVRKRLPRIECREDDVDGELSLQVTGLADGWTAIHRLDNAYQDLRKNPRERDAIIDRWVASFEGLVGPRRLERERVLPLLKSRESFLAFHPDGLPEPGSRNELFHDVVNDDLVLCYVCSGGGNFHFLSLADLATLELTDAETRELARRNLKTRTLERTFIDAPVGWAVHVGGNFEATMLVDDSLWNDARFAGAECVLAVVPDRDTLVASVDASVEGVWILAGLAARLEKSEPHPNTRKIFVRRNGRFEHLDPEMEDLDHPIPRLGVLDVSVTSNTSERLALVIASPLDSGPRSIYRLYRKLEDYLAHLGCDGTPGKLALPENQKPWIYVSIHSGSHPDVLELMNSLHTYVSERGAVLRIKVTE